MEEIRIILELMKNKRKKYNCKFECAGYNVLRDILQNHKTKILHISAHGYFSNPVDCSKNKGKEIYNLCLENLKKNGQIESININQLKSILYLNRANISQLDLVIVSTCYSEDFANLFLEYGAKNIIYINGKTEIIDRISVIFVKYFYQNIIEGQTIKNSYENAIKSMKLDKEVTSLNKNSCCCNHYHKPGCPLREDYKKKLLHSQLHIQKLKKCKCKYEKPNYHDEECECHHHHDDDDDDDEDEHEHHHHHHDEEECDDPNCECHHHHHHHDADEVFESVGIETVKKYDLNKLKSLLDEIADGKYGVIVRSKGIIMANDNKWYVFNLTPGEVSIEESKPIHMGKIVVIGSKIDTEQIKKLF
jgi:hypothetical protein